MSLMTGMWKVSRRDRIICMELASYDTIREYSNKLYAPHGKRIDRLMALVRSRNQLSDAIELKLRKPFPPQHYDSEREQYKASK